MAASAVARDRTKTEHVGMVRNVKWISDDETACILELNDGYSCHGEFDERFQTPGIQFRFMGRWKNNPRWGDQFYFSSHTIHSFAGRTGVVAYLSKTCDGIGEKLASKLWDRFGNDTVRTLREDPLAAVGAGILNEDVARTVASELEASKHLEQTKIGLHELFKGRGFHGKIQQQCITKWGARAVDVIRHDPFKLLGLAGAGFKRCDALWRGLGLPLDRLKRQLYASMQEIRDNRVGHTWVSAEVASDFVRSAIGGTADPFRALKLGIRAGKLAARKDDGGGVWITLHGRSEAERRIADNFLRLCLSGQTAWPTEIPTSLTDGDGLPSVHQVEQLRAATLAPVGCFVGGPGTGKTHTLSFLLKSLIADHGVDSVAVCAPTGKAAVRATHALKSLGLGIRAVTIHQLLEIGRNGHDGGGWGFSRNRDHPLDKRFLIVDESSMIDTNLMADLLDACAGGVSVPAQEERTIKAGEAIPPRCRRCRRVLTTPESVAIGFGPECARRVDPLSFGPVISETAREDVVLPAMPAVNSPGCHVLFVGDPYQLPPVGHGAPLRDLLSAGVPHGELTEVRRNAGRIVHACKDIKSGKPMTWSPQIDLDGGENLRLVECTNRETADLVCQLLEAGVKGFHPVWQTQVVVGLNDKGNCSRSELNGRLQRLLNPDGRGHKKCKFKAGDKVICLRNTWLRPVTTTVHGAMLPEQQTDAGFYRDINDRDQQVYCANGEIGRVVAVGDGSCVCRFGENETLVRVGAKAGSGDDGSGGGGGNEGGGEADFDFGYAVTCHKCQGSESPCVIVVADDSASSVADRSWWYTAISRASKLCVVVGPSGVIDKQVRKVNIVKRKTFLVEVINELKGGA